MSQYEIHTLVFSSSATVYGEPDLNPIPETAPRKKAVTAYGATKAMCEDILEDAVRANQKLSAISLRYFNPVGAHESGRIGELPRGVPNNLVPYITQAASGVREKLIIFGDDYDTKDGTCVRDFIHVMDLAEAHVVALLHLMKNRDTDEKSTTMERYAVYNVGTGKGTSVRELVDSFESVTGVSVPHSIGARREGDIAVCFAGVQKIQDELSWSAKRSIDDALKDAWRWQSSGLKEE